MYFFTKQTSMRNIFIYNYNPENKSLKFAFSNQKNTNIISGFFLPVRGARSVCVVIFTDG